MDEVLNSEDYRKARLRYPFIRELGRSLEHTYSQAAASAHDTLRTRLSSLKRAIYSTSTP